jgi:hypothetical protein
MSLATISWHESSSPLSPFDCYRTDVSLRLNLGLSLGKTGASMRKILLAVLLGSMFSANGQSQTGGSANTGPHYREVKLSIQVVNGKNGVPLGQPGAQPWDVGPGRVPLPDIAFCVSAPEMTLWCTPGFTHESGAKPLCRDDVSCQASVRMPTAALFFEITIKDVDLQFHDDIGRARCNMMLGSCTVGAAVVSVWFEKNDMCGTADVNYELNTRVAQDWKREVERHNKLVDDWTAQGRQRQEKLYSEILEMVTGMASAQAADVRQEMLSNDTRTMLLELRQTLVEVSNGTPLKPEAKAQLRKLLETTLQRAERVGRLPAFQILMRRMGGPVVLAAELLTLIGPAYDVFEAEVAAYDNRRITEHFIAWRTRIVQRATSLIEEGRRNGCPISPRSIREYDAVMGSRVLR